MNGTKEEDWRPPLTNTDYFKRTATTEEGGTTTFLPSYITERSPRLPRSLTRGHPRTTSVHTEEGLEGTHTRTHTQPHPHPLSLATHRPVTERDSDWQDPHSWECLLGVQNLG